LHYLWLVLRGSHLRRDDVQHRRVRSATIGTPEAVPFQLDGDPGGVVDPSAGGPLDVNVLPGEVEVIVA
jgi:diacylglycerol kinase family enzyme